MRTLVFDEKEEEQGGHEQCDGLLELDAGHHKMGVLSGQGNYLN